MSGAYIQLMNFSLCGCLKQDATYSETTGTHRLTYCGLNLGRATQMPASSKTVDYVWQSVFASGLGLAAPGAMHAVHYLIERWCDERTEDNVMHVTDADLAVIDKSFPFIVEHRSQGISAADYMRAIIECFGEWSFRHRSAASFARAWTCKPDIAGNGLMVKMGKLFVSRDFVTKKSKIYRRLRSMPAPKREMTLRECADRFVLWSILDRATCNGQVDKHAVRNGSVRFADAYVSSAQGMAIVQDWVKEGYLVDAGTHYEMKENI
jgi:hypothetical protein